MAHDSFDKFQQHRETDWGTIAAVLMLQMAGVHDIEV